VAPLSELIKSRQQREPIGGRGVVMSVLVQGLTITRLPAPLLLTAANCLRWGGQPWFTSRTVNCIPADGANPPAAGASRQKCGSTSHQKSPNRSWPYP
jgi:hypothetical protein